MTLTKTAKRVTLYTGAIAGIVAVAALLPNGLTPATGADIKSLKKAQIPVAERSLRNQRWTVFQTDIETQKQLQLEQTKPQKNPQMVDYLIKIDKENKQKLKDIDKELEKLEKRALELEK